VYIPPNLTEEQVLAAIERAVGVLAASFAFGCYEVEDIKQEGRVFAMQALPKYDGVRPLENFLYSHVKNRLINLKRNKLHRSDTSCPICHRAVGRHTEHPDGRFCDKYLAWLSRNQKKASLMKPSAYDHSRDDPGLNAQVESTAESDTEPKEILALLDQKLDVEMRADYLRMRAGQPVAKGRRREVEAAVKEILQEVLDG
jgi:DNA-directed RNA polymerase specialized sigma24 family protein